MKGTKTEPRMTQHLELQQSRGNRKRRWERRQERTRGVSIIEGTRRLFQEGRGQVSLLLAFEASCFEDVGMLRDIIQTVWERKRVPLPPWGSLWTTEVPRRQPINCKFLGRKGKRNNHQPLWTLESPAPWAVEHRSAPESCLSLRLTRRRKTHVAMQKRKIHSYILKMFPVITEFMSRQEAQQVLGFPEDRKHSMEKMERDAVPIVRT
nr:PREDICTED: uncharacterized protein LOC103552299 [Equus przewalskii]